MIDNIEEMVLLFLNQLAMPGRRLSTNNHLNELEDNDNTKKKSSKTNYGIELQLVNRKKQDTDRFATTIPFSRCFF